MVQHVEKGSIRMFEKYNIQENTTLPRAWVQLRVSTNCVKWSRQPGLFPQADLGNEFRTRKRHPKEEPGFAAWYYVYKTETQQIKIWVYDKAMR
jgi:hypothetical protein